MKSLQVVKGSAYQKHSGHGTREWAVKTVNISTGCPRDCIYCYAKHLAISRKQLTADEWPLAQIREKDVYKQHEKYEGRVMFPSTHDITHSNFAACFIVLHNLLRAGNEVLIVSKPDKKVIGSICIVFVEYRDKIIFRFSIGATDDKKLSFWEPNAPSYNERKSSLEYAYKKGYQTSISVEPMLDPANIDVLIEDLSPYVTDAIWIGKMNHLKRIMKGADTELKRAISAIKYNQRDAVIKSIYQRYKDNPMIKWKKEIKRVVGIPIPNQNGLDI